MDENIQAAAEQAAPQQVEQKVNSEGGIQSEVQSETVASEETQPAAQDPNENEAVEIKTTDDAFTKAIEESIRNHQQRSDDNVSEPQADESVSTEQQESTSGNDEGAPDNQAGREVVDTRGDTTDNNDDGRMSQISQQQRLRAETEQISNWIDKQSHKETLEKLGNLSNFLDENGKGTLNVIDLQRQTEDGRIIFLNPFDENNPFDNMTEAKESANTFNEYIESQYKKLNKNIKNAWVERYKPNIAMKAFAPRFNQMSELARKMFMERAANENAFALNSNGKFVGFKSNFDMYKVANEIESSIKRVQESMNVPQQPAKEVEPQEPAADMNTKNITSSEPKENQKPKTVEEAFLNAMKKEVNKQKGGK